MSVGDLEGILDKTIAIVHEVAEKFYFYDQNATEEKKPLTVAMKDNNFADLVTDNDVAIERELASRLYSHFPHFQFIGEEGAFVKEIDTVSFDGKQYYWIIDPIDGTVNYIHGLLSNCCISVALVETSEDVGNYPRTVLGIVYIPALEEGKGAFLVDGRSTIKKLPICNRDKISRGELFDSLIATEWNLPMYATVPGYSSWVTLMIQSLIQERIHGIRSFGSAAISLAKVAEGCVDLYYEIGIHSWDIAAGILLVLESGGSIDHISSAERQLPFDINNRNVIAACSPNTIHQFKRTMKKSLAAPTVDQVMSHIHLDKFPH